MRRRYQVRLNSCFEAFCRHWDVQVRACAPFRARTKGKTANGVGYVKKNAIAGHAFESWAALEAHLARWQREVANERIHGTTGVPRGSASRWSGSTCARSRESCPSCRYVSSSAGSMRRAASSSTPAPTACRGG